jgi:hypothetical protein
MSGQRAGFRSDTFLQTTITEEAVCVVVDKLNVGLVEGGSNVCLGNRQTNGI